MKERAFIEFIDGQFPYENEAEWRRLVNIGAKLSSNAAFMVLHEICRVPVRVPVAPAQRAAMLSYWLTTFAHPLVEVVLPAAKALIDRLDLPVEECAAMMLEVARYPGAHTALSIPYFACDDVEGKVTYEAIKEAWRTA